MAALYMASKLHAEDTVVFRRIVVDIPLCRIAVIENGRVTHIYPVAVGAAATPSPSGEFFVATRVQNPTWYAPHKVVPPGKANPLGTRWIGLNVSGYGIHGTNQPHSIGHRASHGCIRMRNRDVEELFRLVRVGDPVELHSSDDEELGQIFGQQKERTASASRAVMHDVTEERTARDALASGRKRSRPAALCAMFTGATSTAAAGGGQ
jgi:hypothetical protein